MPYFGLKKLICTRHRVATCLMAGGVLFLWTMACPNSAQAQNTAQNIAQNTDSIAIDPSDSLDSLNLFYTEGEDQVGIYSDPSPLIYTSYGMLVPPERPDPRDIFPDTELSLRLFLELQTGVAIDQDAKRYRLKRGEGLATLLRRAGLSPVDSEAVTDAMRGHRSPRTLPVNFAVDVISPTESTPGGIRMSLNEDQDLSLFQRHDGGWQALRSFHPYQHYLTYISGTIQNSLYQSGIKAGMTEDMLNDFIHIMSFSVDFQREVQKGDTFELLVEYRRDMITGDFIPGTKIYQLSMTLAGDRIEFFRHTKQSGGVGYFDKDGNSASRALMRTPINGARLTSGYGQRKHPILGYTLAHRGVDFGARTGTPIMAAGDGVVEYSGWVGGYGRYVRIRHNSAYKTVYAHMSAIRKGIKPGRRVSQGEIIGFVGSSGRSTGPHLHYEILVNNTQVNPLRVQLPNSEGLEESEHEFFLANIADINTELMKLGIIRYGEAELLDATPPTTDFAADFATQSDSGERLAQ